MGKGDGARILDLEDGLTQQPAGVDQRVRRHHPQAGDAEKMLFQALAVGGSVTAPAPHRCADDQRDPNLVVEYGAVFRGVIDDLVAGEKQEIAEHDLGDRQAAAQREPGRDRDDRGLGNRRGKNAIGELRGQAARDSEGAPIGVEHVLAQHDDPLVVGHGGPQAGIEAREHRRFPRHGARFSSSAAASVAPIRSANSQSIAAASAPSFCRNRRTGSFAHAACSTAGSRVSSPLLWGPSRIA